MKISIIGIEGMPLILHGDDIGKMIVDATKKQGIELLDEDILVVTQKIVSKAEGQLVCINSIIPTTRAKQIAEITSKDPKVVEVVLRESKNIIKLNERAIISETHHGFICANAGVDASNIDKGYLGLLPKDPDASATNIRLRIKELTDLDVAVVITDTWGRPWRLGQVDFAIGLSGISPFKDYRGTPDLMGYILKVTNIAIVDEIAAAAELVKGKKTGIHVVLIRGYRYDKKDSSGKQLLRPKDEDLFR
jgi:coenzyme F420-0:L-glutamate ligase/coenzyme F420-1:gamma-L-glutamate ligase